MTDFFDHAMLDIETLGSGPGCPILQISACMFPSGDTLRSISDTTNFNHYVLQETKITVEKSTFLWWANQPSFVGLLQRTEEEGDTIGSVINQFDRWLHLHNIRYLWSHGATFDIPILLYAWKEQMSEEFPVPYWNFRDTRTLMDLWGHDILAEILPFPIEHEPHNALHDAVHQANCMVKLLRELL